VAQDKHPFAFVRRANIFRSDEQRRRDVVTQSEKFLSESSKMPTCDPLRNILEEDHGGATLVDDADGVWQRPISVTVAAFIGVAASLSGDAVGLAGRACGEQVNESPQRSGVHVGEIAAENRRSLQGLRFHPGQEPGRGMGFPLAETQNVRSESEQFKPGADGFVEHSGAAIETESLDGISHTI